MEDKTRPLSGYLHHAIATGNINKVQELLKEGACVNIPLYINEEMVESAKRYSTSNSIASRLSNTGSFLQPINESTPNKTSMEESKQVANSTDQVDAGIQNIASEENVETKCEEKSDQNETETNEEEGEDHVYEEPIEDAETIIKSLEPLRDHSEESRTEKNNNRKSLAETIDEKLNDDNGTLIERAPSVLKDRSKPTPGSSDEKPLKLLPRIKRKISIKWQKKSKRDEKEEDVFDEIYENVPKARNVDDEQLNENFEGVAFFEAVRDGMDMIVQTLLETSNNYQLDLPDENGFTPVMQAAWHGQTDCLQILLEHGADTTQKNATGCTAAHFAAGQGHSACLELLLDYGDDVDAKTKFGATPLILASKGGHKECLEILLMHGADPNIQYRGNQNSLLFAAGNGHYECIQVLLEYKVDIDQSNSQKVTPLMRAIQQGHNPCAMLLLDNHADIHLEDGMGRTALHFAVEHKNPKALKLLLEGGANVESKTKGGSSPMNYAERFQSVKCAEILEKHMEEMREQEAAKAKIELENSPVKTEKTATCMIFKNIFRRNKRRTSEV